MPFEVIETQEKLDEIIQERLERERESVANKYSDYENIKTQNEALTTENNGLKTAIETLKTEKAEVEGNYTKLEATVKDYEMSDMKIKAALKNGLPYDMASRLVGEDEESIIADAKKISELMGGHISTPPLKTTEPKGDDENASYLNLLNNLKLEGE